MPPTTLAPTRLCVCDCQCLSECHHTRFLSALAIRRINFKTEFWTSHRDPRSRLPLRLVSRHIPRASRLSHGDSHRLGSSLQGCFEPARAGFAARRKHCQRYRGEPFHGARPLRRVVSLAHTDTVDRFQPTLLLLYSARLSICWITGCCFGGAAAKRWMGTEFGRIYDDSAAGCLQAAWQE